jgi:hypothetical protein
MNHLSKPLNTNHRFLDKVHQMMQYIEKELPTRSLEEIEIHSNMLCANIVASVSRHVLAVALSSGSNAPLTSPDSITEVLYEIGRKILGCLGDSFRSYRLSLGNSCGIGVSIPVLVFLELIKLSFFLRCKSPSRAVGTLGASFTFVKKRFMELLMYSPLSSRLLFHTQLAHSTKYMFHLAFCVYHCQ